MEQKLDNSQKETYDKGKSRIKETELVTWSTFYILGRKEKKIKDFCAQNGPNVLINYSCKSKFMYEEGNSIYFQKYKKWGFCCYEFRCKI